MLQTILLGGVLVATGMGAVQPVTEDPTYPKTLAEFRVYDKAREVLDVPFVQDARAPLTRLHTAAIAAAGTKKAETNPDEAVKLDHAESKARWKAELEALRVQSIRECFEALPRTNMFFWSVMGRSGSISLEPDGPRPLNAREEHFAVSAVLGSPRVRQLLALAGETARGELASQLRTVVEDLLPAYREAYASNGNLRKREENSQAYRDAKKSGDGSYDGVSLVTHTPDKLAVTVEGQRFALLACAWLIGELELKEAQDVLLAIVDEAVRQRVALEADLHYSYFYKRQIVEGLALYNRTLLGTALLRMANQGPKREEAVAALGLNKYQKDLLPVDAEPILRPEGSRADFSAPTPVQRSVELYDNMTDAQFDALRAALR